MRMNTEEIETQEKALFISKQSNYIEKKFRKILSRFSYSINQTEKIPKTLNGMSLVILITSHISDIQQVVSLAESTTRIIVIMPSSSNKKILSFSKKISDSIAFDSIKVVFLLNNDLTYQDVENALWFGLSKSSEKTITITGYDHRQVKHPIPLPKQKHQRFTIKKIHIIALFFCFILSIHVVILASYSISILRIYNAYRLLELGKLDPSEQEVQKAHRYSFLTRRVYKNIEPVYALLGFANTIDSYLSIPELASQTFKNIFSLEKNARFIVTYMTDTTNTSETTLDLMKFHINESLKKTDEVLNTFTLLIEKMPSQINPLRRLRQKLLITGESLQKIRPLLLYADDLIGQPTEQKYLIFFFNNMELRPGGGFIGSYAIATFKEYRLIDIKVEDVYDADGQLKAHVEPPYAIKTYLKQPHWFLRDSNFDPDFSVNSQQAFFFLEKEMGYVGFKGSIGITTTAIQYIIDAIGPIYLPDWQETITKDNFYIKTQIHAEKDFFPGSIQKKSFLNSLMRTLIQKIPETSYQKMAEAIRRSLEEKHLVLYSSENQIQKLIEESGWSGRKVAPICAQEYTFCITDTLFPYDANLGLNKANFYVSRQYQLTATFLPDGSIKHIFKTIFSNESPTELFPGGTYKNYYQVIIPKDSISIHAFIDNKLYQNLKVNDDPDSQVIGVYFEIPPQSTKTIMIEYKLSSNIPKGKSMYQLIVQKQIGSMNNDFSFHIYLPTNIHIINQNFSSLAKDGYLIYNTSLSNDRIFFIELIKE